MSYLYTMSFCIDKLYYFLTSHNKFVILLFITNSRYISYRNDLSEDSQHVLDSKTTIGFSEARRYNPFDRPDPFVGISIRLQTELTTHLSLKK